MTLVDEADQLPSHRVLYMDRCACGVRSLFSHDGLTYLCANCGAEGITEGLQRNSGYSPRTQQKPDTHVVYYLRFGDRVKIGTTNNLAQRLTALPCDEVLATEPGSYTLEKERHQQFRSARIYANREWFHLTDELRMHIYGLARG